MKHYPLIYVGCHRFLLMQKMMVDMSLIPTKEAQELIQQFEELDVRGKNAQCHQPVSAGSVPHQLSHAKANELTLKKLAKAVFQLPLNEESIESISTTSSYPNVILQLIMFN